MGIGCESVANHSPVGSLRAVVGAVSMGTTAGPPTGGRAGTVLSCEPESMTTDGTLAGNGPCAPRATTSTEPAAEVGDGLPAASAERGVSTGAAATCTLAASTAGAWPFCSFLLRPLRPLPSEVIAWVLRGSLL